MRPLSARNHRIRRLDRLVRRRDERAEQRAVVVEGPVLIGEALDRGAKIREVFVDSERIGSDEIAPMLDRLQVEADLQMWSVPADALERSGDTSTSQGIVAVAERPASVLDEIGTGFVLVLVELADPGNVGTLLRSAAAAGAAAVVTVGGVDITNPKTVRASAGTIFGPPVIECRDAPALVEHLRASGRHVAAAVARGGAPHTRAELREPLALLLGNEAHGLDDRLVEAADELVTIEMADTESLNVAMAGTVLCFEMSRRRGSPPSDDETISP